MKASNLVFPTEGLTDNELVLDFVRLSNRHDAETGLADEIATIVMDQTIITKS